MRPGLMRSSCFSLSAVRIRAPDRDAQFWPRAVDSNQRVAECLRKLKQ